MINLNVRKKYIHFLIIRWFLTIFCSLPTIIYPLVCFIRGFINKDESFVINQTILLWCSIPFFIVNLFFILFAGFYRKKLNQQVYYEFCEIVSSVKLPKSLPKVVYVYTCHNDMYQSRVLQNARQTYKNIEIWISEGSENKDVIASSKKFALEHNFNFYAVGGHGSNNKAENLNSFLKNAKVTFDYLLITDSDEALHERFVEHAIKCFKWKNFHNLGFVSARNFCYKTNNLFANTFVWFDINQMDGAIKNMYVPKKYVPLYSASALISKELLKTSGNKFPEGCLEDVFLESIALRNSFTGVVLPTTPSGQAFDKNVKAWHKRNLRINDWIIYLVKRDKVNKYNEKYDAWFNQCFSKILYPLSKIAKWLGISVIIWVLAFYSSFVWQNVFFFVNIIYWMIVIIASFITKNIIEIRLKGYSNKLLPLYFILLPLFYIADIPYSFLYWFKALFLSKYSAFGGSGQKTKTKKQISLIKWDIFCLVLFGIVLTLWTLLFVYAVGFDNSGLSLLYVIFATLFAFITLSFLCEIILFIIGLIPNNTKYSKNDFIETPQALKYADIQKQFLEDHKNNPNYDLSVLN